ncbi:DUF3054 family protein [Microbacterium sp. NPDC059771]|jgi:peptidoglycan/LPS O-acetylase OafA/YrhL|uniref:DUF3054 domain-containing protein n=1 Tax=unclassified Microbacterium TaxID=2609290 RepID=UPI0036585C8D
MRYLPALIVDAVLVLVFAAIGRASHQEDPAGFLLTAWPFLVALLVGYAVALLLPARPRRPWSLAWGAVVWVVTVAGGMLLRVLSGDTAEVPFIVVASIVLGLFLVGWRGLAALVRRLRASSDRGSASAPQTRPSAAAFPAAVPEPGAAATRAPEASAADDPAEAPESRDPDPA